MRSLCLSLAWLALSPDPALAENSETPACMAPVNITASLVTDASRRDFSGYAGAGATPAFLIGWISPSGVVEDDRETGSVIFVRNADASWRAFAPRPGEAVVGVYAAPSGAMIVATQWGSEAPGQSWTLLRSPDGLQSGACGKVRFPAQLNQPIWANESLNLSDLDIDARGRGEIIGEAVTESCGDLWFAYRTTDHGLSWSAPRRLSGERAARRGLYEPVLDGDAAAPGDLVADLMRYAEGR